jgi:hypothetical protein
MSAVVLELHRRSKGEWEQVGIVDEAQPPGSISSRSGAAREVYVFGWLDGAPGVWRSTGGVDVANDLMRAIASEGFDRLSDLTEPYELAVITRTGRADVRFRLTP